MAPTHCSPVSRRAAGSSPASVQTFLSIIWQMIIPNIFLSLSLSLRFVYTVINGFFFASRPTEECTYANFAYEFAVVFGEAKFAVFS